MTVAALPATVSHIEDGVSTVFAVPFRFKSATDLIVERILDGTIQELVFGVDYAVTGGTTDAGGTVTRAAAANGAQLRIRRSTARRQPMIYTTGDRFPAISHEEALDRGILIAQEQDAAQADTASRALLLPAGETAGPLVPVAQRIGGAKKVLAVDQTTGAIQVEPIAETFVGNPGPAGPTFLTLTQFRAAPVTNKKQSLLDPAYPSGDYYFETSAPPYAERLPFVIKADDVALSAGAWKRQSASAITFAAVDPDAPLRNQLDKSRETRSVEDFFVAGDNDVQTMQRAIDKTGDGDQLVFTRRAAYAPSAALSAPTDGASFIGHNTLIQAAAGSSFENMLLASGRQRLKFQGLEFDANGTARANGQTARYMALVLTNCTDVDVIDVTARNVRGLNGIPGVGLTSGGTGQRVRFINPRLIDCGVAGFAADGIFCSTDDSQIINGSALRVTDTAFVLESCNNSQVVGGVVRESSVAAALTNATSVSKRGNRILGVNGLDMRSDVTGWVQIGALGSGGLYDSHCDIKLQSTASGFGGGPGINIRQPSTGVVDGVRLTGSIYNPGVQAILNYGKNVTVQMAIELLTTNQIAMNFQPGSSGLVLGSTVRGGSIGLATFNGAKVRSVGSTYDGQASFNLYAFAPSQILSMLDNLGSAGVTNFGAENGTASCSVFGGLSDGWSYQGKKVGGVRGSAIANATDASSTQARLNDLLNQLRSNGTIAP